MRTYYGVKLYWYPVIFGLIGVLGYHMYKIVEYAVR